MPPEQYAQQKVFGLEVLQKCVPEEGQGDNGPADVDAWLREIRDRGWMQLDWFANVGEGVGVGGNDENVGDEEREEDDREEEEAEETGDALMLRTTFDINKTDDGKDILLTGLGTMVNFPLPLPPLCPPKT